MSQHEPTLLSAEELRTKLQQAIFELMPRDAEPDTARLSICYSLIDVLLDAERDAALLAQREAEEERDEAQKRLMELEIEREHHMDVCSVERIAYLESLQPHFVAVAGEKQRWNSLTAFDETGDILPRGAILNAPAPDPDVMIADAKRRMEDVVS